jgi:hypothetical protein
MDGSFVGLRMYIRVFMRCRAEWTSTERALVEKPDRMFAVEDYKSLSASSLDIGQPKKLAYDCSAAGAVKVRMCGVQAG